MIGTKSYLYIPTAFNAFHKVFSDMSTDSKLHLLSHPVKEGQKSEHSVAPYFWLRLSQEAAL